MLPSMTLLACIGCIAGSSIPYGGPVRERPGRQVAAPTSLQCRTEYVTLWDTTYQQREEQVCTTVYEKQCRTEYQRLCQPTSRQECSTVYQQQCATVYRSVCVQEYTTEYEPYTESECSTQYKEDCEYQWEGAGNDKVWAPIPGTCNNVPYDECHDVTKTHAKQVARPVCRDVPEEKCVSVPKQACVTVADQVCKNEPFTECQDVPQEACHAEHKKFPVRVSRRAPKQVCATGYGAANPAPQAVVVEAHSRPGPVFTKPDPLILGSRGVPTTLPEIIAAANPRQAAAATANPSLADKLVFSA